MLRTSAMSALLLTTALYGIPAMAQTAPTTVPPTGEQTAEPPQDELADSETQQADQEDVEVSTPGTGGFDEPIVVQGRFIPDPIRNTASVVSVLSAEEIARTGDGDIASSLERVTGLSVDSGGFVYVRGLGDRYSQALLNGTPLPSPEPLQRVIPLEIFPTSVLSSAVVQKSYSVNYPGEFGGGIINLTSSTLPEEDFLTIGAGLSINTETTGDLGYTHYGSDSDFTGFDDGTRDIPDGLQAALNSGNRIESGVNFSNRDLQNFAASLVNADTALLQRNLDIPPSYSVNVSGGYTSYIGDAELGVTANFNYSNDWFTRDSIVQSGTRQVVADDGRNVRTDNNVVVSGLVGFGLDLNEQKLRWTTIFIRDTLKQSGLTAADNINTGEINPATPADELRQSTNWIERQLLDTVVGGEFTFGDFDINLRGNYANTQREAPYQRDFTYFYDSRVSDYVNNLTTNPQLASISFSDLNEDVWSGAIDVGYNVPTDFNLVVSAGYAYSDQSRDAVRRDFRYLPLGSLPDPIDQQRPDFLLSDFNIYGFYTPIEFDANGNFLDANGELINTDGIILNESGSNAGSQAYQADLTVHGAYVKLEAEPIAFVTVDAGVRYETAEEQVVALDLFGDGTVIQTPALENDYFLPAATLTWNFAEDMQIRVNGSKTIARPQFRELARPQYINPDNGRIFNGNPFLVDSELINAEARYEWYFGRDQRFSIAGFYKSIDNPIEPVAFLPGGASTFQTTFANAPEAELYGAEVELVKNFDLSGLGGPYFETRRIFLSANYTYTQSELKIGDGDTTILNDSRGNRPASQAFRDGAPLTGQSEHLANLQIGLEDTEELSQITFLLRYASDRVTTRGPIVGGQLDPDLIEEPGLQLDLVARQALDIAGQKFELKFEARNLTGEDFREFQQGDQENDVLITRQQYDLGRTIALSVAARF